MTRRPRHLCHVCPTFAIGGRESRMAAILNALGRDFAHTLVALDGNYQAASLVDPRVRLCLAPANGSSVVSHVRALTEASPDLVLTYNWGAIDGIVAALALQINPVIHMEDGFGPDEVRSMKRRRVLTRRLLLNRIHSTIVPSSTLQRIAVESYRIRLDRVRLIPNGVDVLKFRPGRDSVWRDRHAIPPDAFVLGIAARLRPEKNIPLLLDAFSRADLPQARLAILGDGPERAHLEETARRLNLGDRVIFAGSSNDPARFYAALDVFVMSSATEQRPMALLEAMACGLPIIATDVGDITDMLGSTCSPSIVPAGAVEAYANAISTMAQHPGLRVELGAANRARCVAEHSADRMMADYLALYESALAGRALN